MNAFPLDYISDKKTCSKLDLQASKRVTSFPLFYCHSKSAFLAVQQLAGKARSTVKTALASSLLLSSLPPDRQTGRWDSDPRQACTSSLARGEACQPDSWRRVKEAT